MRPVIFIPLYDFRIGFVGGKFISLRPKLIDQIPEDLRVGGRHRVEEDNCSWMSLGQDRLQGFRGIRLIVHFPIPVSKAPEYAAVAHVLHQFQRLFAEFPFC